MDKRLTAFPPKRWRHPLSIGGIAVVVVCVVALIAWLSLSPIDPYTSEVLTLNGNAERGQAIFQANCAVCHGLEGNGNIGPSLVDVHQHRSAVALIQQVVSGKTPPMPQFQPNPQEMADLLNYLKTL
ncbi:MAG: Cytochrome [Cyanobacteriota bacterium]